MKVLLIGGTGTISSAITKEASRSGMEVCVLNRGSHPERVPENVRVITADVRSPGALESALDGETFDAAADFIAFRPEDVKRDIQALRGRVGQFVFISTAMVYQKPPTHPVITEGASQCNPFSDYAQQKIICEQILMERFREERFPVTIVRPSHTYDERKIPVALHGGKGSWQVAARILEGKPVIIPGDGTTNWTATWAGDFAKGFIGLLGNPHAIGESYTITSDEVLTWNRIYQIIADTLGKPLHAVHIASDLLADLCADWRGGLLGDKSNSMCFDTSKLKRDVPGFKATTRFDQGIRMTLDYMLAHPDEQTPDYAFDAWCDAAIDMYKKMSGRMPKLVG